MKQRLIYVNCLLFALVLIIFAMNAQEKAPVWDFPVRPGTEEWKKFTSIEEQYAAYNIPTDLLQRISTAELVQTCLKYPEWGLMYAFNSPRAGFDYVLSLFNGFKELFSRKDVGIELLKVYKASNPLEIKPDWTPLQSGLFSFEITKLEMLLSTLTVIKQLDDVNLNLLLQCGIEKYQAKAALSDIYSLWSLSPTAYMCLRTLQQKGVQFSDKKSLLFEQHAVSSNKALLDSIINKSINVKR